MDLDAHELMMELLEERAINRNLDRQLRRTKKQVADLNSERKRLQRCNSSLRKDRTEARAIIKKLERDGRRQSRALTKTSVLLSSEREIRMHAERELECCQRLLKEHEVTRMGSSFGVDIEERVVYGPTHLDLVERVSNCMMGTVSSWVRKMQAECHGSVKEVEVLSWLLHKVFFLCADLIEERREELSAVFRGKRSDGVCDSDHAMDPSTAAFMQQHLCRHYLTLFPLCGEQLKNAHDKIASSVARSMTDSTGWSRGRRESKKVVRALLAHGLGEVVTDYLGIMVSCCLQQPPVTFTDDLGKMQPYTTDTQAHAVNAETQEGDICIVIFPAMVVAGEWGDHEALHERYVLVNPG